MHEQNVSALTADMERELEALYQKYRSMSGNVIPILQEMQEIFGYLPEDAVNWIADRLDLPRSKFFGVATFYLQFHLHPRGKNIVTVCCGTACHVKGAEKILDRALNDLGLTNDQNTTGDMQFTVDKVACLGTCSMAPAVLINKKMHGGMKPDLISKEIKHLKKG